MFEKCFERVQGARQLCRQLCSLGHQSNLIVLPVGDGKGLWLRLGRAVWKGNRGEGEGGKGARAQGKTVLMGYVTRSQRMRDLPSDVPWVHSDPSHAGLS